MRARSCRRRAIARIRIRIQIQSEIKKVTLVAIALSLNKKKKEQRAILKFVFEVERWTKRNCSTSSSSVLDILASVTMMSSETTRENRIRS